MTMTMMMMMATFPSSAKARYSRRCDDDDDGEDDDEDEDDDDDDNDDSDSGYLPLLSEGQALQEVPQARRFLRQLRSLQLSASALSSRMCSRTGGSMCGTGS